MKTEIWNGTGYQPLPNSVVEPEPPTLDELKAAKIRALNNAFHLRLNDGHVVDGVAYSLTETGRRGYVERGLLYVYAQMQDADNVGVKDKDENIVAMNFGQFKSRMVQVGVKYETLVAQLAARKADVEDALDAEDLDAISEVFV